MMPISFPDYPVQALLLGFCILEQFQIIHIGPRMIIPVYPNISTALFNQFRANICFSLLLFNYQYVLFLHQQFRARI